MEIQAFRKSKLFCLCTFTLISLSFLFCNNLNAQAEEIGTPPQSESNLSDIKKDNNQINNTEQLIQERGMEWIGDVLGAIGNAAHPVDPQKVIDQLNGKYPNHEPAHSCSPGGTGGTPNACNF